MLKPFDGNDVQPHYVTCMDIETSPAGDIIAIGFAYQKNDGQREYEYHEDTKSWLKSLQYLLRQKDNTKYDTKRYARIFAHNGANFDYLKVYEEFVELDVVEDAQYFTADSTGIGCSFKLKGIKQNLYLMDSYRLMPASLAKLGETYQTGNRKQNVPNECKNDYKLFKDKYPVLFAAYLMADVLSLQEIILKFWKSIYVKFGNVGQLPMTLPALALRAFSKGMSEPLLTPEAKKLCEFERAAYKGGLTLCMRTGVFENVNVYDVNSMYPNAMAKHEYPASYVGYWTKTFDENAMGLWEAEYEQTNTAVPPLLFDTDNGASYDGRGIFTSQELLHLQTTGGTFKISDGYVYEEKAYLFRDFVETVYQDRQDATKRGDEALAFTLKILLNSLYGKFAQRQMGTTIEWYTYDRLDEYVNAGKRTKIMGDFLVTEGEREVPHVFVAIAAMITANARIDLHRRMTDVFNAGFDVYYCDTDSIHTNGTMLETTGLGGVKLENSGKAAYAGRKLYAFEKIIPEIIDGKATGKMLDKIKAKGIGRNQVGKKLSYETIETLALNKDLIEAFTFEGFPSVRGVLSKREKAAVMRLMTRRIRNTGGIWDE